MHYVEHLSKDKMLRKLINGSEPYALKKKEKTKTSVLDFETLARSFALAFPPFYYSPMRCGLFPMAKTLINASPAKNPPMCAA